MTIRDIVVGVDGSTASLAAVRWAAHDAARRDLSIRAVVGFEWAEPGARLTGGPWSHLAVVQGCGRLF